MKRSNRPQFLDQQKLRLRFGLASKLETPLTPYTATKPFHSTVTPTPLISSLNSSLPSPRVQLNDQSYLSRRRYGIFIGVLTVCFFCYNLWALVICRMIPKTNIWIIEWYRNDHYYCYLIPVLGPAYFYFQLVNWLGMKYFKHNA
jgi:phosphatidylinositol glycan anchor class Y biosynthesis protein